MDIYFDTNKTEQRRRKLNDIYNEFYCDNQRCKYYNECSQEPTSKGFINGYDSSYSAKLGEWYDLYINGKPLRIVVVGKEAPSKSLPLSKPARLSDFKSENGKGRVNKHYQETYKMLCYMFNHSSGKKLVQQQGAVLKAFCLTNLYRCAFKKNPNDRTGLKNNVTQFQNCRKILQKELQVLEPTILILQNRELKAIAFYPDSELISGSDRLYYSRQNDCYIIESAHPCVQNSTWYKFEFPLFKKQVNYLQNLGVLPTEDVYVVFDAMEV